MVFLLYGSVFTQHAGQDIMFLLQPLGLRVKETISRVEDSALSVLQCVITIQETGFVLSAPFNPNDM